MEQTGKFFIYGLKLDVLKLAPGKEQEGQEKSKIKILRLAKNARERRNLYEK